MVRAYEYVRLGKVLECEANADFSSITGVVAGSHAAVYEQEISIYHSSNKPIINGYCSCPVGRNCKHVAAILIRLIHSAHSGVTTELSPLDVWLKQLPSSTQVGDEESGKELIFILSCDSLGAHIELRRTKLGKKGFYGKGSKLSLSEFSYYLPHWLDTQDKQLIQMLLAAVTTKGRLPIEDDFGMFILQRLAATQRLFWEHTREPLVFGSDSQLKPQWHAVEELQYQLKLTLEQTETWELIATEPPCFIDLNRNTLGIINTPISAQMLLLLSQMPAVARQKLTEVGLALSKHLPVAALNLPVAIKLVEVHSPMRPRLILTQEPSPLNNNAPDLSPKPQPLVMLDFIYGEYQVSSAAMVEAISQQKHGRRHVQIHRQLAAEQQCILQLLQLGLHPTLNAAGHHAYFSLGSVPAAVEAWLTFTQQHIPELIAAGFEVITAPEFSLHLLKPELHLTLDEETSDWFSLALSAEINGAELDLMPLIKRWISQHGEPQDNQSLLLETREGELLQVAASQVKPLINIMLELLDRADAPLKLPISRVDLVRDLQLNNVQVNYSERVGALIDKLRSFDAIATVDAPAGLQATLRDYQQTGLNWLCFLKQYGFGGILADDMGLGKTLQALAFIYREQQLNSANKTLIVCPTSLLGNWQREAQRFTPDLTVLVLHGHQRKRQFEAMAMADVVITSYPLIQRDSERYLNQHFDHLILDEAQHIKNAKAKVTQTLMAMPATMKLCLSGTPMENHIGELKSLMDFVLPGLLGNQKTFNHYFKHAIEKEGDARKAQELGQRVAPFLLRRTKQQVANELPAKTEITCFLPLEKDQRNLYESIRVLMEKRVRQLFADKGMAKSHIEVLDALLKLRQACCDPRLVKLQQAQTVSSNAKLAWLSDHVPEMVEEGRKILIFSQFTSMLSHIQDWLDNAAIPYSKLTGQTKARQEQIDQFQQGSAAVFLISLKAGGTGLNLTAADTVIHFDPWWNPAAERQATDRAHRMGQDKPVFVYKLIAEDTVEEKIQAMQNQKQGLADSILSDDMLGLWQGNRDDLLALFN
ncbi:DEAD/DEAH box helicase [Shewanella sp. NIFS-20-20]|nr:DEAD/DEAH box helicase [Shewanella sp. NIFS-20-20]